MGAQTVVILGGGVGGIVAANELARRLPDGHRIVLVERSPRHAFAPSFLWLMTGDRTTAQVTRDLRSLIRPRVEIVQAEARSIDWMKRRVEADARVLDFDHLVIALGAELAPEAVPGLPGSGHTFYSLDGAERLAVTLDSFTAGSVAVVVAGSPYKCPGAPHEGAMLLSSFLRRKGLAAKSEVHLFTPEPQAMPVAGPELGAAVAEMLRGRGITLHPSHRLTAVDPARRELLFDGQPPDRYDLLVAIPPHRAPGLVKEAGLVNEAGWVPVDRRTLATSRERVYALGDVTSIPIPGRWSPAVPLMLPKAGVFAHDQARVVARRIAAEVVGGQNAEESCGDGYCMIEAGEDVAGFAFGNFFAEPSPDVRLRRVGRAWHLGKVLFERWWLSPFGVRKQALQAALEWGARAYGARVSL